MSILIRRYTNIRNKYCFYRYRLSLHNDICIFSLPLFLMIFGNRLNLQSGFGRDIRSFIYAPFYNIHIQYIYTLNYNCIYVMYIFDNSYSYNFDIADSCVIE